MKWLVAFRQWIFEARMQDHEKALQKFREEMIAFRLSLSEIHFEVIQAQSAVDTVLMRLDARMTKNSIDKVEVSMAPVDKRPPRRFDFDHRQIEVP